MFAVSHIVVDDIRSALTVADSRWAITAALASTAAAVGTLVLAWVTRNLAYATSEMSRATKEMVAKTAMLGAQTAKQTEETALSTEQAQRHHEQALMPIVWVELQCKRVAKHIEVGKYEIAIGVGGTAYNTGSGPTTSVYLHLKASSYRHPWAIYLGLVGPNAKRDFSFEYPLGTNAQALDYFPYDCVTRFTTIFGTEGAVFQHSYSGKSQDAVVSRYILPSTQSAQQIQKLLSDEGYPTQLLQ